MRLVDAVRGYLDHLRVERALARNTLAAYGNDLRSLAIHVGEDAELGNVDSDAIASWMLANRRRGLSPRSSTRQLSAIRGFFEFMVRERVLVSNPTKRVESPKVGRTLPRLLSAGDVDRLLNAPPFDTDQGRRHRTMLHVLYASGLRVSELVALGVDDLDEDEPLLHITGKGGASRLVPIGEVALDLVAGYICDVRARHPRADTSPILFLSPRGTRYSRQAVWRFIRGYAASLGLSPLPSPHTLRHSFATHLLRGGANLRAVQAMLGHAELSTTEIYTHVDLSHLRAVHAASHPRSATKAPG